MVYVMLADGFEEVEAIAPVDLLRRAGLDVKTVGVTGSIVKGAHGLLVRADISPDQVIKENMEMIVLPGGQPGTNNLKSSETVEELLLYAVKKRRYIAAICAAPTILAKLGLLKDKFAVCFPSCEEMMTGASIKPNEKVVVDGHIITAKAAGCAIDFGLKLIEMLAGERAAKQIKSDICYG